MVTKTNVPNIGDYDIVYGSTQMCACCDAIWASNMDDYKSTSNYVFLLRNGASTKITRSKLLLLCHQQKCKIWQLHKQFGFHHFLGTLVFYRWNPSSYMMTIEVVYFFIKEPCPIFHACMKHIFIIWCKRRLREALLSWCIANVLTKDILLMKMNISNIRWVWVKCVTLNFVEQRCWISTSYQVT